MRTQLTARGTRFCLSTAWTSALRAGKGQAEGSIALPRGSQVPR